MVGLCVQDRTQSPGMQVASGCLLTDSAGNVLLVKPTYKPPWEVPGGAVERAESPLSACRREVREEPGVLRSVLPQARRSWRVGAGLTWMADASVPSTCYGRSPGTAPWSHPALPAP